MQLMLLEAKVQHHLPLDLMHLQAEEAEVKLLMMVADKDVEGPEGNKAQAKVTVPFPS
jgi:hypothetical protein